MTMMTQPKTILLTVVLALVGGLMGCDAFKGAQAKPLRVMSEQPEEGWNYAEADGVQAACPKSWLLEASNHPRRAWRCSHPASLERPAGCGLTVYGTGGSDTLEELVEYMKPEILAYGEENELISENRSELGGKEAQQFVVDHVLEGREVKEEDGEVTVEEGEAIRGWYRLVLDGDRAWIGHCILPQDLVERDQAMVEEVFSRVTL